MPESKPRHKATESIARLAFDAGFPVYRKPGPRSALIQRNRAPYMGTWSEAVNTYGGSRYYFLNQADYDKVIATLV